MRNTITYFLDKRLINKSAYYGSTIWKIKAFQFLCYRWPGASLIVIEGHKNLKECAYVGDNSSEERDFSASSEEDRNLTVINHMTKVVSGMILNDWKLSENSPGTTANQTNNGAQQKNNLKRQNVHLKYAEELYLKENRKKLNLEAKQNQQKNVTSKVTPSQSDELLTDIVNRLELLGNRGKQVVRHLRESIDKELAKDANVIDDAEANKLNGTDEETEKPMVVSRRRQADLLSQILDKIVKNSVDEGNHPMNDTERTNVTVAHEEREFKNIKKEILYHRMQQLNMDVDNEKDAAAEVNSYFYILILTLNK